MTTAYNFLGDLISGRKPITIFLINGVKLTGVVTSADRSGEDFISLVLERDNRSQLVMAHAISTVMPM